MSETQTNKLVVINNGRCGQNSGILREKFTADVLQVRPKPDYVLISDGVHLTLPGNKLLARTFLDVIAAPLRGGETIVCVGDSLTYG